MVTASPSQVGPASVEVRQRLSGAQIIAEYLCRQGVPYAVGIPGHGSWTLTDALIDYSDRIKIVKVMHEQSAIHLADGYYRASGQPLLAFTSIGPGASNTVVGIATAFVDSTAVMLMTGSVHTYMRGHAVLQEIERRHVADFPRVLEPVVKEWWQPSRVDELPFVLQRGWNQMLSGRPGPVLLDVPMDVQADSAEVQIPSPLAREARARPRPAADAVERAAEMLRLAQRPVIVAGGGLISADATDFLVTLAERVGAAVVTTYMGKGSIDEMHELNGWSIGDVASSSGNALAASADVILSIGCRFTDWTASAFRKGATFAIPPTQLIQVDIDPREIGKNYPVSVALLADAREALKDLLEALGPARGPVSYRDTPYFADIQARKNEWEALKAIKAQSNEYPMTQARAIAEIQSVARPDAIVVTGAGVPQGVVRQNWVTRFPRTHLTSGGFSTMGFTVPAAIGAKLARPDRQVIAIAGDGDFLQTMQELASAAMLNVPVTFVILNNSGWISIKGGQLGTFDRSIAVDFTRPDGSRYSPDYRAIGHAFGIESVEVREPSAVAPAIAKALITDGPSLVVIEVARDLPNAVGERTGWWDAPVPEYHPDSRARYLEGRAEEQHR